MEHRTIAFIGAGNMACAIISGLLQSAYPSNKLIAVNRSPEKNANLHSKFFIQTNSNVISSIESADVVVLAVKPQGMEELLKSTHQKIDWTNKLVISIAAGISIERLDQMANVKLNLIRAMPNTPSLIGEGMTGIYAPKAISLKDRQFAIDLLCAVGKVHCVDQESEINGIIAAAGSSPAYFFLFIEAMQEEAIRQGFDPKTARELVQQAALGAAKMVIANPATDISSLREQVTSKGGTTAEALHVFNQHQLSDIVAKAMQAAVNRAEEMESLF